MGWVKSDRQQWRPEEAPQALPAAEGLAEDASPGSCPHCQAAPGLVYAVRGNIRHHRCRACGGTYKTIKPPIGGSHPGGCPACRIGKCLVYSVHGPIRYHRCQHCGHTLKTVRQ